MATENTMGEAGTQAALPAVRAIGLADPKDALAQGWDDFGASRLHVMFPCLIYPIVGLVLARLAAGSDALPLFFPLCSGFALVGPFAAIGVCELSRRREQDRDVGLSAPVRTSVQAVLMNPHAMAIWGLIVAGLLVIGSLPFFVGLAVVIPLLGHATWHLYRKVVAH